MYRLYKSVFPANIPRSLTLDKVNTQAQKILMKNVNENLQNKKPH